MGKNEIISEILAAQSVLLVGHQSPDGDSIGCQLALHEALLQLGKQVKLQSKDPVPKIYRSLAGSENFQQVSELTGSYDLAIMVECPTLDRSGFDSVPASRIIGIDHHPGFVLETDAFWCDTTAGATAELLTEAIPELGAEITKTMAQSLLCGIMTDTGNFTYSNTTARTLAQASILIACGANTSEIADIANRSYPIKRLGLMADLLSSHQRYYDDRLAILSIDYQQIDANGYDQEMFEDMVNIPLSAAKMEAAVLLRQDESGLWRGSLRSKGKVNVSTIANTLGGGGHKNAAGCRSNETLELFTLKLLAAFAEQLEE
jgi:phosphoesterase RecJ-like protein